MRQKKWRMMRDYTVLCAAASGRCRPCLIAPLFATAYVASQHEKSDHIDNVSRQCFRAAISLPQ